MTLGMGVGVHGRLLKSLKLGGEWQVTLAPAHLPSIIAVFDTRTCFLSVSANGAMGRWIDSSW